MTAYSTFLAAIGPASGAVRKARGTRGAWLPAAVLFALLAAVLAPVVSMGYGMRMVMRGEAKRVNLIPGGGDQAADDLLTWLQTIASTWQANDAPAAGGTLTLNSQALGSYDFRVIRGNLTISSFDAADYFTDTEDSRSAILVVVGNLTINAGQTVIPAVRKLFTAIYVTGNLAVAGGISMTARGADHSAATGSNITAVPIKLCPDGTYGGVTNPVVPAAGGAGGAGAIGSSDGTAGVNGSSGGTGGGGSGGSQDSGTGDGAPGTSFSGGAGSGGAGNSGASAAAGVDGGSGSAATGSSLRPSGGGAGNPGGSGNNTGDDGDDGTGGTLFVMVEGDFSGSGLVAADGANGGNSDAVDGAPRHQGGGASGGGHATVMYGTDSSSVTISATGGAGGVAANGTATNRQGGAGGDGTARKLPITAS